MGLGAVAVVVVLMLNHGSRSPRIAGRGHEGSGQQRRESITTASSSDHLAVPQGPPFAVGVRTLRFIDSSRLYTGGQPSSE